MCVSGELALHESTQLTHRQQAMEPQRRTTEGLQRPRALLNSEVAEKIYIQRPRGCHRQRSLSSASILVSRMFSISPKAIRDIWNRRTWIQATKHLWDEGETRYVAKSKNVAKEEPASPEECPQASLVANVRPWWEFDTADQYPHSETHGFGMEYAASRSTKLHSLSPTSSAAFSGPSFHCPPIEHEVPDRAAFHGDDVKPTVNADHSSSADFESAWMMLEGVGIPPITAEDLVDVKQVSAEIADTCRKAQSEWMICPKTIGIFLG